MSFKDLFSKKKSAGIAKDRLRIMLAHERVGCSIPYLEDLRNDLIEVIKKYVKVEDVKIKSEKNQNLNLLEVDIILGNDD